MNKILIIGSGGREHVLAASMAQSDKVETVYCAPGNGGTALEKKCVNIPFDSLEGMADFAEEKGIDLTIPGAEVYLCDGVVDLFRKRGLKIFGPHQKAAMLEGSKSLAKDFMKKYGVKTAAYEKFSDRDRAMEYLADCSYPQVVKADGLAAGKGVIICQNREEAERAVDQIMVEEAFGQAGSQVVIEEFLEGKEASILALYDGFDIIPFLSAKDHKKIGEGETGLNTGGMGVVAPNPLVDEAVMDQFNKDIMEPTVRGLKEENLAFAGIIFFGLMMNDRGVFLLEYNMRFGDPEAQTVLPMFDGDWYDFLSLSLEGRAADYPVKWKEGSSCCVVMASGGYPESYGKGYEITGYDKLDGRFFVAGGELRDDKLLTSGGRVLNVVARGKDLDEARKKAYEDVEKIHFDKAVFRTDIGL
ncbi:MAG: phosphoribosylamine--glycine ligase [Spirochaetales bacterium]|nr:phosphoribosylamine--glycine ligase [Spirochaetales bacterium]